LKFNVVFLQRFTILIVPRKQAAQDFNVVLTRSP